jgi:hypothetical protein
MTPIEAASRAPRFSTFLFCAGAETGAAGVLDSMAMA